MIDNDLERRVSQLETIESGIVCSNASVSSPPTDAELDTALGTAGNLYDGFMAIVDSGGTGTTVWLCVVKNSAWWYEQLTKAV